MSMGTSDFGATVATSSMCSHVPAYVSTGQTGLGLTFPVCFFPILDAPSSDDSTERRAELSSARRPGEAALAWIALTRRFGSRAAGLVVASVRRGCDSRSCDHLHLFGIERLRLDGLALV